MRWIRAFIAILLAAEPCFAAGRAVSVKSAPTGPSVHGAVIGSPQSSLALGSLNLGAPTLTVSDSLPLLSPGLSLPDSAVPVSRVSPVSFGSAAKAKHFAPVASRSVGNAADASNPNKEQKQPAASPREVLRKKLTAIGRAVEEASKGSEDAPAEQSADIARKQFDALGTADTDDASFEQLLEQSFRDLDAGRLAPAGSVSADEILRNDAPKVGKALLNTVKREDEAITRGVEDAVATIFKGETISVVSRGSTARGTFEENNPDHDIMVELPTSWSRERLNEEMSSQLPAIREALERSVLANVGGLGHGQNLQVRVGGNVQLSDPATRTVDGGVYMLPVQVFDAQHQLLLDIDVTFTNRKKYTNAYPAYFADQLQNVSEIGGQEAVDQVLSSIRLAKSFFKRVVGAYKVWRGGPSGVGVEQMIMQSGLVEASDKGRTVREVGDFDKFIDRIHEAAFDENGSARSPREAKAAWLVFNPFREPLNFVEYISDRAWKRLAAAASEYRLAKGMGRSISFEELSRARRVTPAKKVEKTIPVRRTVRLRVKFSMKQDRRGADRVLRDAVRDLEGGGDLVLDASAGGASRRSQGARDYTVNLLIASEASVAEISERLRDAFLRANVLTAESAISEKKEVVLFLRRHMRAKTHAQRLQLDKTIRRLGRRLKGQARVSLSPRSASREEAVVRLKLEKGADAVSVAEMAGEFFKQRGGSSIVAVSLPEVKDAQDAVETKKTSEEAPGAMTLEMLENFTEEGAVRPSERGDEFLYAQGAKVLPAGLEATWEGRTAGSKSGGAEKVERLLLRRMGDRTVVMLPSFNRDGRPIMKSIGVPGHLASGIVTDTLVEVGFRGRDIVSVESIGAYPMDVMIGRIVQRKGKLQLEALLRENKKAKALYPDLDISGKIEFKEGDIVQAFVKPDGEGYEAEALLNLGAKLTPEIAAREIALRHGARGYFDEAVVRQAEEVGRTQDPSADFKAITEKMAVEAPHLKISDMSDKPFVTIDPVGAGDLDDAYYVEKHQDGSYTWYLATADVGNYVEPGTPAFKTAALIGNTFYSVDKNGVPEYPMNHPVVSKYVSSLLAGKESLAMITKMRFSKDGTFLGEEGEVSFGLVSVKGRYTYDQVVELWKGKSGHGVEHLEQVSLARELAGKLDKQDAQRGKLALQFQEIEHRPNADGTWSSEVVERDPLASESHKLIEELKVYGNRGIAAILEKIKEDYGVPHISRVHPSQSEAVNKRLRKELSRLGIPWPKDEALWDFLRRLNSRQDLTVEGREAAQILALRTRRPAEYDVEDGEGHEGLALEAGQYDHPSTPIRRFADMYNRALLESYLSGGNPRDVFEAVEADLRELGFRGLEEYMQHLNGREKASKSMDREMDNFMAFYELAKPERRGKTFKGFVKVSVEGKFPIAVIQLTDIPVSFSITGPDAEGYKVMDGVQVKVNGADPKNMKVDAEITRDGKRPVLKRE